uniref:nucleotidyltransferase family protein n=1 Tax=Sphingomonas sp. TaxID=28214 RepID=UPI0025F4B40F|nr:nucleotidyltransferase family protein [Sphingomonas sp.]
MKTLAIRPDPGVAVPNTAMVMAAGLGTRMRPLSVTRPKPLIQIKGTTFIDHVLDHLRAAGVMRIVVNVHYMADMLEAHLAAQARDLDVRISDERTKLLDTGGGLFQALPLIDADPFFCVNTDNIWIDGPMDSLKMMARMWNQADMDVLMLLVPLARANQHAGQGDFYLDPYGRLTRRRPNRVAPYVWAGIQLLSKSLVVDPPSDVFSTNVFWDRAITSGRAYGLVHQGLWFDVGTPGAIPRAEAMMADG